MNHSPTIPTHVRLTALGGWLLCTALVLCTATSAMAQDTYGLPDGWVEVDPHEGRLAAVLHSDSLTRMEGWRVKLGEDDLDRFQAQLKRRLQGKGFELADSNDADIDGLSVRLYRWNRTFRGRAFAMQIVEVYRRGELWQFSSVYLEGVDDLGWEAALMTFAKALLS
ncbi:MAG: hypothetical protein AAFS10_09395 [Myxococcota bacterium]